MTVPTARADPAAAVYDGGLGGERHRPAEFAAQTLDSGVIDDPRDLIAFDLPVRDSSVRQGATGFPETVRRLRSAASRARNGGAAREIRSPHLGRRAMTSRYLPKVLFAVFLCASPVDVSAMFVEPCLRQSVWMPTPEELMKFKTGTTKDRPNFCKADLSGAILRGANLRGANLSGASIFRIWPKDRVELKKSSPSPFLPRNERELKEGEPILQKDGKVERLQARSLLAIAWAAWFSLLSAFQIGFREFSVGNWLTRVHPRQFTLEPTGWVRTVAGDPSSDAAKSLVVQGGEFRVLIFKSRGPRPRGWLP